MSLRNGFSIQVRQRISSRVIAIQPGRHITDELRKVIGNRAYSLKGGINLGSY